MAFASKTAFQMSALALALASIGAPAANVNWANDTDGFWNVPANWLPGLPTSTDDVFITSVTGLKTITHNTGNDSIRSITTNASAALLVNGGSSLTVNSGASTNGNTMRADGVGSALTFNSGSLTNNGTISATNSGTVNLNNLVVRGGTLSSASGGTVRFSQGTTLDGTVGGMTLSGSIVQADGIASTIRGNITNNGNLQAGTNSNLMIGAGGTTLGGNGTLTMSASNTRVYASAGSDVLTNTSAHTIRGVGQLGINLLGIANQGLITANVSGGTLTIDPSASGVTNTGTLRSEGGGSLVLTAGTFNNVGGTIGALAGSTTTINGSAVVQGGTLTTVGTGIVALNGFAVLDGTTSAITNTGNVLIPGGGTGYAIGTISNQGSMTVGPNANLILQGANNLALTGTGTVTLGSSSSRFYGGAGTNVLTIGAGQTVQGEGQLGVNLTQITNGGLVVANAATGITIDPSAGGFVNNGTLRADGATLTLSAGNFANQGALIEARNGSTTTITGSAVVQGGTLATSGTGVIVLTGSALLDGATLGAVNTTGALQVPGGQTGFARGTINDTGAIAIGSNGDLRVATGSDLAFTGNGTVTLNSPSSRLFNDSAANTLTNGASHTIQGEGQIGVNQSLIRNAGLIVANAGAGLVIDPSGGANGLINTGTMRADGATLSLTSGIYNNQAGLIEARGTSSVIVTGATVQGGSITTSTGGTIVVTGSAVLDGSTLGAVTLTGNAQIPAGQTAFALGSLINNGAATIGVNADLRVASGNNLALNGTGTLTLGSVSSRLFTDGATGVISNAATHTIQGEGQIGANQTLLRNAGLIVANSGTGLVVDPSGGVDGFINTGTLRADGARLSLGSGAFNNAAGLIEARNGSVVALNNGGIIQGGTIASSTGGTFAINDGGVLDGTVNGAITSTANASIAAGLTGFARGTIVDNGTIGVGGNADLRITSGSDLTLNGSGTLTLAAANTRLFADSAASTFTNGVGHTVNGQGQIGVNQTIVVNGGTIRADVAGGSIVLNSTGPTTNLSTGVLAASNNGTLNISKATNGAGTIQSSTGGTVVLNAASTTGRLVNDANLSLGINNVTVSSDYSNANFGVGNGFNKRANVAGTGLILASGTTAQAVTGATVTAGATAAPTLVINNVRVGSTTYNYQVANAGTSGPALRGAIQTNTAGGNITDARLSGSGVTSGNYGPVATGSNSGDLGVTFTTTTAGLIAPLVGQAVHLANNFANVAEQTLNIVTGAGAAAYNAAIGSATPAPTVALGNTRIGGTLGQTFTVRNTATAGAFSEDLNAAFGGSTGAATAAGSINGLVAGGVNGSAMSAALNTGSAGAKSGTVTLNYATAGTVNGVSNGLGTASVGNQTITLAGNVYQTAAGTITTAPLNFGTVQVGQTVSQTLTIQNTATGPAGFVEDLNARFGATSGTNGSFITGSGTIAGLAAGAFSNGLTVGVNTSTAGTVNGSIAVNFFSAGSVGGVGNGLGELGVGSAAYGVNGTITTVASVVNQASPVINNSPIALGNVRIGSTSPTGLVSVTNQATVAPQAALSASITGNAGITASGSFSLLDPGATNATSLAVGLNTATAGNKSGTATIAFVSDASNIGGCAPACALNLPSQDVAVTGAVYRLANPTATPTSVTVAGRVGSVAPTTAISVTNVSPDLYTEGLSVTRGATSSGFTSSGAITNLVAGGTSGAIGVTLDTATAGTFSGTQALNYVSTGTGTTGAADLAVGSGSITLNGKVYTTAAATVNTPSVNFGIVHVGDAVSQAVSVTNSAPVTALNDVLVASATGASGPFTASGNLGAGLAAGATSTALSVGLNTTSAGVYAGSAAFSAASHDADLTDAALAALGVSLSGTVNNYAADRFSFASGAGTLTQSGSTYILDYGSVLQGSGTRSTTLLAGNSATGPADLLDGNFEFLDALDFAESGFASFMNLAAGQTAGPLTLSFDSMTLGSFMDTIVLHGVGSNASGYSGAIGDIQLIVRGSVTGSVTPPTTGVPEPDSLLLLGLGIPLLFIRRRNHRAAH